MSNMSMTKYGKYKNDGLWLIKRMRWIMVDEMNEMDYGRWNEWGRTLVCEDNKDGLVLG